MKTLKFPFLFVGLLALNSTALAVSDFTLSGQFNVLGAMKQLPTRDQGITAFSIPSVRLDVDVPLKESNELFVELETSEFRDRDSKRYDTQLKEAYVNMLSLIPGYEVQYGLVPNSWVQFQREGWGYDFWGPTSEVFLIRYRYSAWADLGVNVYGSLPNELGEWTLSVVNGEGAESEELGKHKEVQAIFSWQAWAPVYLSVGYLQGNYDVIGDDFNSKQRWMVELSYGNEMNYFSLSYYNMKDPADIITTNHMASDVNVTAFHGTNVEGQAVSLLARRKITARSDVFLRGDWLQPVKSQTAKVATAAAAGFAFESTEDMLWVFGFESSTFDASYAPSARDQSQFLVATQVRF